MTEAAAWCRWKLQQETKKMTNENVNKWKCDLLLEDIKKMTWQIRQHSHWAYLLLMDTRKSLGVDEKSSKLAMTNCFTWMGSQSSIMNLSIRETVEKNRKLGLRGEKKRIDSFVDRRKGMQHTRFYYCRGLACINPYSPSIWLKCSALNKEVWVEFVTVSTSSRRGRFYDFMVNGKHKHHFIP